MVRRLSPHWLAVLASLGLSVASTETQAQERPNHRTLNGHSFITGRRVRDPFVATYLRSVTGYGRAIDLEVPVYNLQGDQIAALTGDILFFQLGFEYQQRLADWVAVSATYGGLARLGTNHVALIAEGATATYGGSVGATFGLAERERFIVSAIAEARSSALYTITPLTFARGVAESGGIDSTTQLLDTGRNWRLVGGLRGGYAFGPSAGVTGLVEFGPASRFFENDSGKRHTSQLSIGGTTSFDLRPRKGIPVGFLGSVLYQSVNERGDDVAGRQVSFELGVFYTGRNDFSVGAVLEFQRLNQQDLANKINASKTKLLLRYDF